MLDFRKIIAAACDAISETLYPTRCVGCDLPGVLLCQKCSEKLFRIDRATACPRCSAPYSNLVCTECAAPGSTDSSGHLLEAPFAFDGARCACSYEGVAKRLVCAYKDGGEQRLSAIIAQEMAAAAGEWVAQADALVAIPATPSHLRARGWDHMELVARDFSKLSGLPLLRPLVSAKAADQRLLGRAQRAANREDTFRCIPLQAPLPHTVLLLDDVLTTGSTCSAAASALKSAGARRVVVSTFARVW